VGDVVFLIDVAFKHTPIKVEVWMVVTMMITMLASRKDDFVPIIITTRRTYGGLIRTVH
jgi:hypothetical protein